MAATSNTFYVKHTAADDTTTGRFFVTSVIWSGTSTHTHLFSFGESDGTVVLPAIQATTNVTNGYNIGPIIIPINRWVNGIKTITMGSGSAVYLLG